MTDGLEETEVLMTEAVMKLGGTLPVLTHEVFRKIIARAYVRGLNDGLVNLEKRPQPAEATQ